ncbi:hypothetical protein [Microbulbifer aggregans]|uniref:hypothetical protein n=1 Tax=Microbulbifer aggregans TaxID=1769779 RepID=UPI001CFD133A|nr:hypothetical protein [Microbulbifer aggregans]
MHYPKAQCDHGNRSGRFQKFVFHLSHLAWIAELAIATVDPVWNSWNHEYPTIGYVPVAGTSWISVECHFCQSGLGQSHGGVWMQEKNKYFQVGVNVMIMVSVRLHHIYCSRRNWNGGSGLSF